MPNDEMICSVYGVGSTADADNIELLATASSSFRTFENYVRKKFRAVVPGEIGGEVAAVAMAQLLGLKVVDADLVGGRAVPNIDMDVFNLYNLSITPLAVVVDTGEILVLDKIRKPELIEKSVRSFVKLYGRAGFLVGYSLSGREAKRILPRGTISRSIKLGEAICRARQRNKDPLDAIVRLSGGREVLRGSITKIELKNKAGFLVGRVSLRGKLSGKRVTARVLVKNENIALVLSKKQAVVLPDLIVLVNPDTGRAYHNAELKKGAEVGVISIPALPIWKSARGLKIMNTDVLGV